MTSEVDQVLEGIDDEVRARKSDPYPSQEAAYMARGLAGLHGREILSVLFFASAPLTAEQIADRAESGLNLDKVKVGRRLNELERGGLVVRLKDRVGRTRADRKAGLYQSASRQLELTLK